MMLSADLEILVVIGQTCLRRKHSKYPVDGHGANMEKKMCYELVARKSSLEYEISEKAKTRIC